jgi:acetamidase/formamidase/DNA-binding beta-propeller fold protein YncE
MNRIACFLILGAALPVLAQTPVPYRITRTYDLGGDGGWDYIVPEPAQHRFFIGRTNRVMVVDEESGKLLGEVTGINGAHGTAVAAASGHGFATSGNDQSVVMFDLKTFKELARIPAAEDADAIIYDPASNRVFTFNGDAHSSTVIDPVAGKRITNIDLGGKPEYGASAGDGKVYANLTDISEVVEIDAKTATVSRRWSTSPCKQPVAMAIDATHHRLFSGCRSGVLAVSDYQAGKVITTLPIGMGVDGTGYDPSSGDVFATNADGTLTVIHQDAPDNYHVIGNVSTPAGSRNMGLDPTTHRIYVAAATFAAPAAPAGNTPPGRGGRPSVVPGTFKILVIERVPNQGSSPKTQRLEATPSTVAYGYYWAEAKPALRIASGDIIDVDTLLTNTPMGLARAGVPDDQIQSSLKAIVNEVTGDRRGPGGHILTGPVYVEGAQPGDVLEVKILSIDFALDYGYNGCSGFLPENCTPGSVAKIIPLDKKNMTAELFPGIVVPLRPFFGSMGVAPAPELGRMSSNPPGRHAGNLDNKELVAGSTLYIPVFVPGALFEIGDGHAAQGDGEVDQTAIETSLRGRIQLTVRKGPRLNWPRAETSTDFITMAADPDLTVATKTAIQEMVDFIADTRKLTKHQAYQLVSISGNVAVTQLVDKPNVGVHVKLPKNIFK